MNKKTVDDKLFTVKCKHADETHLIVNTEKCKACKEKDCLHICPAKVYEWHDEDQTITVAYENCLECGACRIGCCEGAIDWNYPKAGYGVTFKYG